MSYTRDPWHIWSCGEAICFKRPEQDASESICVPDEAMVAFIEAWLRMWPAHMTAAGMLKRLPDVGTNPTPRPGEFWQEAHPLI